MKLYYPVAALTSVVSCAVFAPVAASKLDEPLCGLFAMPYSLTVGLLMGYLLRKYFHNVGGTTPYVLSIPLAYVHCCLFGALYGLVQRGPEGLFQGYMLALVWTTRSIWLLIPLALASTFAIKCSTSVEVDDLEFGG